MLKSIKTRWHNLLEEHYRLERFVTVIQPWVPPLNYITIHYTYFILGCLLASVVFWGSSPSLGDISYVDSLFLVTSAMTNTGLNTVNVSSSTTWQQVLLWLLMLMGSPIWISLWTVLVRKRAFENRFEDIVIKEREMRRRISSTNLTRAPALQHAPPFTGSKSEPNPNAGLGLLRSRRVPDGITNKQQKAMAPMLPIHRTMSAPEDPATAELHSGGSSTIAANNDLLASPSSPDHISFADGPHRAAGTGLSIYQAGITQAPSADRLDVDSASTGSDLVDDIMYGWRRIVGKHKVSRNGQFFDLSSDERDRIGGCEYRALKILSMTVLTYFILFQLLGSLALGAWIKQYASDVPEGYGVKSSWWTGIFLAISTFNNCGISLLDDSMIPFAQSWFPLIVTGLLTLAGNTAYPILLRLILWMELKVLQYTTPSAKHVAWKETVEFVLKYPRRVYTTLFSSRLTWWLLAALVIINGIDWFGFETMNIGNPDIEALSVGQRVMDGLYQAVCLRTSGLLVIPLSSTNIDVQFLYLIMMYISIYPVVITMRNSNVYEERSLGIYDEDRANSEQQLPDGQPPLPQAEPSEKQFLRRRNTAATIGKTMRSAVTFQGVGALRNPARKDGDGTSRVSFLEQQIRGQLAHDAWWLVLAILIIVIIETDQFRRDPLTFSTFNIIFECVSAYGGIGMSTGLSNQSYSFSGAWHTASKVLLCGVMMRGRHRGLPVALDRAVRLPGEKLYRDEEEDHRIRRTMTMSRMSREMTM